MFGVAMHIALKLAIKSHYVLQKNFSNFYKPQFQTGPTKNPKKDETIATSSQNDLLTLNYGLPSSFTTLSS